MKHCKINLEWQLEYSDLKKGRRKCPAQVPGAIQLDIAKAEDYGPYYFEDNWQDYLWMENQSFSYQSCFKRPDLAEGEGLFFICQGIDYRFDIVINKQKILNQEGMFTPVDLDLSQYLEKENLLEVLVHPAPKSVPDAQGRDRFQADQCCKPACSYGWDWHPRLLPAGIWDECYLLKAPKTRINQLFFHYDFDYQQKRANCCLDINTAIKADHQFKVLLSDQNKNIVFLKTFPCSGNASSLEFSLSDLEPWWSHDQGMSYLYNLEVQLLDKSNQVLDKKEQLVGFRTIRLEMNEGTWDEPEDFPKSRSYPPATFCINGRRIFAKGTNLVPISIFPGIVDDDDCARIVRQLKAANFNIVRVWGGGGIQKEEFYKLCDQEGILLWQEFPLACNNYRGTKDYLKILKQEAEAIIRRVGQHACLALWCGGNELFNNWSGMTDQSLALRLLNALCLEKTPQIPFIATSPLAGMGHGHYLFKDPDSGEEVFSFMARAKGTAYSEFGMPAPSPLETFAEFLAPENQWPPGKIPAWENHSAYNAWQGDTWLCENIVSSYFGKQENLDQLIVNGQLLQAVGFGFIFEEARRQKPYCSMALNWCFNDSWPVAANTALLDWKGREKAAYKRVKQACRPRLLSIRLPHFSWQEGEQLEGELWFLNDSYSELRDFTAECYLICGKREILLLSWPVLDIKPNINVKGPSFSYCLPKLDNQKLYLEVRSSKYPEFNSRYVVLYRIKEQKLKSTSLNQ